MKGQGIDDVTNGWHPDERHWLEEFRNTLRAAYGNAVEKALLFGSRARGDWRTDSDIDVMVIVKEGGGGDAGENRRHGDRARVRRGILESGPVRSDEHGVRMDGRTDSEGIRLL